jgi:hypothetical protein
MLHTTPDTLGNNKAVKKRIHYNRSLLQKSVFFNFKQYALLDRNIHLIRHLTIVMQRKANIFFHLN